MRILGLDLGARRIGVAISDAFGWTAQPLPTIDRKQVRDPLAVLAAIALEREVEEILFGLPLNMDGSEGPAAVKARRFAESLAQRTGLPIRPYDERLTSVEAERILLEGDLSRKKRKQKVDQVAAQLILQGYLDELALRRQRGEEEG